MNGSKWTWLHEKCIKLGYKESAKLAHEIEDVLHRLYPATGTKVWTDVEEDAIEETFNRDPFEIIGSSQFCCACEDTESSKRGCHECLFGKEVGTCDLDKSIFAKFCGIFQTEESKK